MKKILIMIFLFSVQLIANDYINVTLVEFADRVSKQVNKNIYIDEEIIKNVSLYVPDKISNKDLLSVFKYTIRKNGFVLYLRGNTYYLRTASKVILQNHIYKMKYNSFKDCSSILTSLNIKYTYLNDSNSLLIQSNKNDYENILSMFKTVDVLQHQVMVKIMIFEYDESLSKERGVQYASIYKDAKNTIQTALNTIVFPLSSKGHILDSTSFYGAIRLLNEQKDINVKQYPFILAKNNKIFKFEAVENIPYLVTTTTTEATNTSEQNSIEYKDVGLKINGKTMIHDTYAILDIDLIIEDLISDEVTQTPQTYKRVLKSNTNIEYGKVLLLSGIKRVKHLKNDWSIPYLSNIPYLGEVFKYKTKSDKELNITIAIEIIKNVNDFKKDIEIKAFRSRLE